MAKSIESLEQLVKQYRDAAHATGDCDSKVANKSAKALRSCYLRLRESVEGKEAIVSLIFDPSPHVRCWAAAHSLEWAPESARVSLESLRDGGGPCSFDAKWTLKEFEAGNLSFD